MWGGGEREREREQCFAVLEPSHNYHMNLEKVHVHEERLGNIFKEL